VNLFVANKLGLLMVYTTYGTYSKSALIPGVLWYIIHSHLLYVERFLFDANYEVENRRLLQLMFISHAIKGDKMRKLKLKISNAYVNK